MKEIVGKIKFIEAGGIDESAVGTFGGCGGCGGLGSGLGWRQHNVSVLGGNLGEARRHRFA